MLNLHQKKRLAELRAMAMNEGKEEMPIAFVQEMVELERLLVLDEDPINPQHYREHPSGVECIRIAEWMNFCLGNAVKYIWRAGLKGGIEDLKKARWYLDREITRLESKGEDV